MSQTWPRIFLDCVHKQIIFQDSGTDKLLLDLIDCREFQRLRRIKQLGMSELVFPGTTHTRFAHSLGVLHMAKLFLQRIEETQGTPFDVATKKIVLSAALLHDVGHGPFSHAFEKITGEDHEARTREVVLDPSTEVHKTLSKYDKELPESVADFWEKELEDEAPNNQKPIPTYLTQVVSSQLDADRFDYLLRDSHAAGVDYGLFDARWLLTHLNIDHERGRFFLSNKALLTCPPFLVQS